MVHHTHCPVCKSAGIRFSFSAKDHTVSQHEFAIWKCNDCTVMFTQDVPDQASIGSYYASANYISHSDTKEGLINKLYHRVRNITIASKTRLLQQQTGLQKGNMLDIGSGTGVFLSAMR